MAVAIEGNWAPTSRETEHFITEEGCRGKWRRDAARTGEDARAYIDSRRIARAKFAAICYLLGFMPVKQLASPVKER